MYLQIVLLFPTHLLRLKSRVNPLVTMYVLYSRLNSVGWTLGTPIVRRLMPGYWPRPSWLITSTIHPEAEDIVLEQRDDIGIWSP